MGPLSPDTNDHGANRGSDGGSDDGATREREATPDQGSMRVLVVDDDPIVAESLAEFVRAEGDDATTAHTGSEAIAALGDAASEEPAGRGAPFQVMLCDVGLPDMDGMRVLEAVGGSHPEISSVMLTGYGSIEWRWPRCARARWTT